MIYFEILFNGHESLIGFGELYKVKKIRHVE